MEEILKTPSMHRLKFLENVKKKYPAKTTKKEIIVTYISGDESPEERKGTKGSAHTALRPKDHGISCVRTVTLQPVKHLAQLQLDKS